MRIRTAIVYLVIFISGVLLGPALTGGLSALSQRPAWAGVLAITLAAMSGGVVFNNLAKSGFLFVRQVWHCQQNVNSVLRLLFGACFGLACAQFAMTTLGAQAPSFRGGAFWGMLLNGTSMALLVPLLAYRQLIDVQREPTKD